MYSTSTKTLVDHISIAVFWESQDGIAPALQKVRSALALQRCYHPCALDDMQSLLPRVLITAIAVVGQCVTSQGSCLIDRDALASDYMTSDRLAAAWLMRSCTPGYRAPVLSIPEAARFESSVVV